MSRYRIIVDPNADSGYEFRGDNAALFTCHAPQAILSGPADTGKTVAACTKLHWNCQKYPGSQHSMVRKTYSSMPGSVCQTFTRIIAGANVKVLGGDSPRLFTYPNGSQVWVGGLDNPDKTLSSERDTIYVNQAEELTRDEWETISTRCTGRGGKVKHPQLYGDCNPSGSKHWIRELARRGDLTLLVSKHKDNPTLYRKDGTYVEDGEIVNGFRVVVGGQRRMAALEKLTGVRGKRLRIGLWVTAEGAVYDNFDASIHVCVRDASEMKLWYLTLDEGFTNPAVILQVGSDSDGRWHVFKEFYQGGQLQETVVKEAVRWFKERQTRVVCVDEAAAGLIAGLVAVGLPARGGKGRVKDGIDRIQNRLSVAGDGKPRLTFDPSCVNCINEFESYVWEKGKPKDVPKKEFDHTSDALRYLGDVLSEPTGSWTAEAVRMASTGYERSVEALDPFTDTVEVWNE
jgi:phage terminase large subunit